MYPNLEHPTRNDGRRQTIRRYIETLKAEQQSIYNVEMSEQSPQYFSSRETVNFWGKIFDWISNQFGLLFDREFNMTIRSTIIDAKVVQMIGNNIGKCNQ